MIVVLCVHGEAKPHRAFEQPDPDEFFYVDCPGGRVLEQAIIIEVESSRLPGETFDSFFYPRWACDALEKLTDAVGSEAILDALASAQETR